MLLLSNEECYKIGSSEDLLFLQFDFRAGPSRDPLVTDRCSFTKEVRVRRILNTLACFRRSP